MSAEYKNIGQEEWFQTNPLGLMLLDARSHISAINPVLEAMLGLPSVQLCGHDKSGVPDGIQVLFGDAEKVHLSLTPQDRWLQRRVQELMDDDGTRLALHYFEDVTELHRLQEENQLLRQRVEELAITDELTGLANQRALSQMLTAQVTRSRRYQNPLSLAMVEIGLLGESGTASPSDNLILAISRYLRDRLRWADVIGRWDESQFILMLPETPGDAAQALIEKISGDVPSIGDCKGHDSGFQLRFSLVEWHKGLDTRKMIEQLKQTSVSEEAIVVSCGG
jgi:diguanylate cyclase (GGDEF)-like protein